MHETLNSISLGPLWFEYLLFFVISFVNVFLQNVKNIFLIKSSNLKAALVGVLTSVFFTSVMVLVDKHGWSSIYIVAVSHFFGIYSAKLVCNFLERKGYLKDNE